MFGNIANPFGFGKITGSGSSVYTQSKGGSGLIVLINNLIKFAIVLAGLYTLLNLILAGFSFISAGGDPKNISKAWDKIWQSIVGLLVVAGSLLLAMIFGQLIFGDATALIKPKFYGP
jgi:hypothetical protein